MEMTIINPNDYLQPDLRWSVWNCNSHEEYLNRYLIKGRFHENVPEPVRSAYYIVERLIAYSWFHYPMIEEVISKMTRIFEMSVRLRAESLGIKCGKLYDCLNKLKQTGDVDPDLTIEWDRQREIRNYYAHPENHSFSGPNPLVMIYPMLNTINRLFCPKSLFELSYQRTSELIERTRMLQEGFFIIEIGSEKRLATTVQAYFLSPDGSKSLWEISLVGTLFPQTIDEYYDFNPLIMRLQEIHFEHGILIATDAVSKAKVVIYSTEVEGNLNAAKKFKKAQESAEEIVRDFYNQNTSFHRYYEKQKFIYDEYWT